MSRKLWAGLFAAFLVTLTLAAPAGATYPGGNGLIAVASQRDGNAEIYTLTPSGLTQTRLTDNAAADFDPAFSSDGSKIAFVSDRDGDNEIYVMNADGSGQTRITHRVGDDMDPAFSPDGDRLLIRRSIDGNNEVVAIDAADGGNAVNLSDHAASDFEPEFSPDGTKIVFQRFTSGAGEGLGNEIFLMNADGTAQVNLTSNLNTVNDGRPSFSPDGTRIAFDSNRDGQFDIYTMGTAGENVARITEIASGVSQEPAFAPNGNSVAFRAAGAEGTGISRVAPSDGTVTAVSTGTGDSNPSWAADDVRPVSQITDGPDEGSTVATSEPVFTFESNEPESTFECRIGTSEWSDCTSPHTAGPLADGERVFTVRSTDSAGNTETPGVSRTFTVNTPPVVTIGDAPAPLSSSAAATISFTVDDAGSTTECRVDADEETV
ncbi:MAG: hypothetical protein M3Y23_05930, partial [Actinomycetota bacterium]|nr:hypothetical protein [Actinomycetota bacterium]